MSAAAKTNLFEDVFKNVRKAAESNMKMQQEMFRQWSSLWPGLPNPQSPNPQSGWTEKVQDFQKQWSLTISSLARKHREVLDQQFQSAIKSLDEALRVTESTTPDEFKKRSELFIRKALECMREISEAQMKEVQESVSKWSELVTKAGT